MAQLHAIFFAPDSDVQNPPVTVRGWLESQRFGVVLCRDVDDLMARTLRGRPPAVVFDGRRSVAAALAACRRLKVDSYTAVVPAVVLTSAEGEAVAGALAADADEVIPAHMPAREVVLRLDAMLRRADRDVHVHPSTRLPGAPAIEAEIARRIAAGVQFAVCYADLDHFKEFNDRYGYNHGDRVILIVSRILRDVVRAHSPSGFVGHIGGDDFIFTVPLADYPLCCADVVEVFDELIGFQYTAEDRERGSFVGKDRRGNQYEVPLMTLSIGVVTNENRRLTHPGQISELATEMKSYAKTFPGSLFVVDRRTDEPPVERGSES